MSVVLRVLLVEDSTNDAMLLDRALRTGGFDPVITRVQNESEMRVALVRPAFDVILTDWHLPAFGGLEAVRLAREKAPGVPVIMLSGVVGEETAVQAMKAGVQDYVMKDKLVRLAPAVRRELAEVQLRRDRAEAQNALRDAEDRFRMFMQHLPGAAFVKDSDLRLVYVNDYFRTALDPIGFEVGRPTYDLLPSESVETARAADQIVLNERHEAQFIQQFTINGKELTLLTVKFPLPHQDGRVSIGAISLDITERQAAEDRLLALTKELRQRTRELEKKNVALSEVLGNIEKEKANQRRQIAENIERRVLPTLRRLEEHASPPLQNLIDVLRAELAEIAAPFVQSLHQKAGRLTSRELEICRMIKHGLATKEIAEALNLSPATVQKHREMIRRKLGISGADVNLHTFLQSL